MNANAGLSTDSDRHPAFMGIASAAGEDGLERVKRSCLPSECAVASVRGSTGGVH